MQFKRVELGNVCLIYALWNAPQALPIIKIHRPVLTYIMRGAHLMIPGVLNWPCNIAAGSIAAVVVDGDPKLTSKPFPSREDLSGDADVEQNKSTSTTKIPDEGTTTSQIVSEEAVADNTKPSLEAMETSSNRECETSGETNDHRVDTLGGDEAKLISGIKAIYINDTTAGAKGKNADLPTFPQKLVDHVLRLCFLQTLHGITDAQLPMEISALYGEMVACGTKLLATSVFKRALREVDPCEVAPENATQLISYKSSSSKKLIKLFQNWAKEGLISLKESKGTGTVVNVNRSNEHFVKFKPFTVPQSKDNDAPKVEKIKVKRYLAFSATQRKMLAEVGVQVDKEPLTLELFKKVIIDHISNDGATILKHVNEATQYHQIVKGDAVSAICKGPAQPVTITVEPRGNRKHVTTIKGLFNYLFDAEEATVVEALRRKFASSGKVAIERELIEQFGMSQQQIKLVQRG
ncbi:uncharacterized protein BXIN_2736 [Babesia sp. Xinjiang]|uniref:uncharacterized protein n=1 Tax=Babesia sp. Xinjiang TaxID=462227 RepID=UPI000A242B14|nr:uncharacterized protein BXIN_2736 [Babesia sp. Xinjiang]ORM41682.1 hypothetical protein BXIN_2736 [Babesia sp. Xinjiang]